MANGDQLYKAGQGKEGMAMKAIKCVFGSTGYPKIPIVSSSKAAQNAANTASAAASQGQGLSTALDAR